MDILGDFRKGGIQLKLTLIILVSLTFLIAIFTSGYNDKPSTK